MQPLGGVCFLVLPGDTRRTLPSVEIIYFCSPGYRHTRHICPAYLDGTRLMLSDLQACTGFSVMNVSLPQCGQLYCIRCNNGSTDFIASHV